MEERSLGKSGLFVSSIGLGTMTWGRDTDIHEARDQFNIFRDAGGTLIDTADVYSDGASEEILGEFLCDAPELLISTKAGNVRTARKRDSSRGHLLTALDQSLRRLRRDHIDIWHLHAWDHLTPLEESLSAMDIAVSSGRVRYIGVSNFAGWQMTQAHVLQAAKGAQAPIVSTQMEYSLLERGIEREVLPAAQSLGIGVMAWSPLGRGVLTGKYRYNTPADSRAASPHFAPFVRPYLEDRPRTIVDAVATAAEGLGLTTSEVSLGWIHARPEVSSIIVGARTATQLRTTLSGQYAELPREIITALNDVSAPHRGYPDSGWAQQP